MTNKLRLFDFSRRSVYLAWSSFVVIFLAILLIIQLGQLKSQMSFDLNDRAKNAAHRVADSVSPTVWAIFKKSDDRRYSEDVASAILDAELNAEFIIGIKVYGNFSHLLMAKVKNEQGKAIPYIPSLNSTLQSGEIIKVKWNISQGHMTIGHVEVFYSQAIYLPRLQYLYVLETLKILFATSLILISFYFIRKSTIAKKAVESTLNNLRDTQNQLIESEKMASLGTLIAGVAHEINTPLGISITATSVIKDKTTQLKSLLQDKNLTESALVNFLETVDQSVDMSGNSLSRVSDLILNFKQVVADQVVDDVREINLGNYIHEVLTTLSVAMKRAKVKNHLQYDKDILITTPPGAVAQIITNLVNNSLKHAFENKRNGYISIIIKELPDESVEMTYKDNGCGMNDDVLKNIYEPFFTTKRNDGGTGLGMNIVYNLIKQKLQGSIKIHSAVGKGASFIITLPKKVTYKIEP